MDSSKTNYDLLNKRGLELDSLMTKKIQRSCHNYLFIDPRLAILRSGDQSEEEKFETFLSSIFYVGQGKKSRPFQHLIDAKLELNRYCNDLSSKIKKIHEIWNRVVILQIFNSSTSHEASNREACMIKYLGLEKLTNQISGVYNGIQNWSIENKRILGASLLYRGFKIYSFEGGQQLRPEDL